MSEAPGGTSVVIPTIGRPAQLQEALASLAACRPAPDEVIVVDQSGADTVARVVAGFEEAGAHRLESAGRGIGLALNAGLQAARGELVFVTNDDCTVAVDWIAVGQRELDRRPDAIVTGSVHPVGDPELVPSLKVDPAPRDYTGTLHCDVLYGANMAARRAPLLELGGFDERINPSSEDNDLCYRWLRAGRPLLYAPQMRVWHHDWRSPRELGRLYLGYGRGRGVFFAKHLLAGDRGVLRFLANDLRWASRATFAAVVRGRRPPAQATGMLAGLPAGLVTGWRLFRR